MTRHSAFLALMLSLVSLTASPASARPRSVGLDQDFLAYDFQGGVEAESTLTIEAWVYREGDDAAGCQTIVENGIVASFWLGICPDIQFMRAGVTPVTSGVAVPRFRWSHVVVSYDGAIATFYLDGNVVASQPHLEVPTPANAGPLRVGALRGFGVSAFFHGRLDELRVWSIARSGPEIRADMHREVRAAAGLRAAFGFDEERESRSFVPPSDRQGAVDFSAFGVLPRALLVPETAFDHSFDGVPGGDTEFAGAEIARLPSPWGPDREIWWVHDDDYLHIGIPADALVDAPDTARLDLWIDPERAAAATLEAAQARLSVGPDGTIELRVGDGDVAVPCSAAPGAAACQPGAIEWARANCNSDDVVFLACAEIRIRRALLAGWSTLDGTALGWNSGPGYPAGLVPGDASATVPSTWAAITYGENTGDFARATFSGSVNFGIAPNSYATVPGYDVRLSAGSELLHASNSGWFGNFDLADVAVPSDRPLTLSITACPGCRASGPVIDPDGIQPDPDAGQFVTSVTFPPCLDQCVYAAVDFFVQRPIDPITIDDVTWPDGTAAVAAAPGIVLRQSPDGTTDPDVVRLVGANLHPWTEVQLAAPSLSADPASWDRYPAQVVDRAANLTWIDVRLPILDRAPARLSPGWRWVVKDNWTRPDYHVWNVLDGTFNLTQPPYPTLHGLGFTNEKKAAPTLSEFDGVFGNNAYICLGALGACTCRIRDPLYLLYYPIYYFAINSINGSCVGMSATSLLMSQGEIETEDFDPDVSYPAGFYCPRTDPTCGNQPGPDYHEPLCSADRPRNLWATIRGFHGVQMSAEFVGRGMAQLGFDLADDHDHVIIGDPVDVVTRLSANPYDYVLCMSKEGNVFSGHCVVPYGVEHIDANTSHILIYDDNAPWEFDAEPEGKACAVEKRIVVVDRVANEFQYDKIKKTKALCTAKRVNKDYRGTRLTLFPSSLWKNERHMPLDPTLLLDFLYAITFGDGEVRYEDETGVYGEVDGQVVATSTRVLPVGLMGDTSARPGESPVVFETADDAPAIHMRLEGGHFMHHSAQGGAVFQIEGHELAAGSDVRLLPQLRDGKLLGAEIVSSEIASIEPRIGLVVGDRQRAVYRWAGLTLPAGHAVTVARHVDDTGVALTNHGDEAISYYLTQQLVDGETESVEDRMFGPFDVPAHATHHVSARRWPSGRLVSEVIDTQGEVIDRDRLRGLTCEGRFGRRRDCDRNGVLDACEIARGDALDEDRDGRIDGCWPPGHRHRHHRRMHHWRWLLPRCR